MSPLVSVIIPAFNAARTIARAIDSAQRQTIRDIEVLVIDDGSSDSTADIAEAQAGQDSRLCVIRQPNAGVAAARAAALALARGEFIAPLDADDIWHPAKLERQAMTLRREGSRAGLAYNWFRRIDDQENVFPGSPAPHVEGMVLHRHLEWNFISNGSNILVPSEIARNIGYSAPLPGRAEQGAEDYLFQLRIARQHRFVCIPAWLTGYRISAGGLSTKVGAMLRAHLAMYAQIEAECAAETPSVRRVVARRLAQLQVELARNRLLRGAPAEALSLLAKATVQSPGAAADAFLAQIRMGWGRVAARLGAANGPGTMPVGRFDDFGPEEPDGTWQPLRNPALIERFTRLDQSERPFGQG